MSKLFCAVRSIHALRRRGGGDKTFCTALIRPCYKGQTSAVPPACLLLLAPSNACMCMYVCMCLCTCSCRVRVVSAACAVATWRCPTFTKAPLTRCTSVRPSTSAPTLWDRCAHVCTHTNTHASVRKHISSLHVQCVVSFQWDLESFYNMYSKGCAITLSRAGRSQEGACVLRTSLNTCVLRTFQVMQ